MSNDRGRGQGVMEGAGAYNRHAQLPGDGAALAVPVLERAVREMELPGGDEPIVIADYGSSQGRNSLAPMRVAVRELRARVGATRAIRVYHVDQPSNDFNSLFEVLHGDEDSYIVNDSEVYPAAVGKSFFQKVFPSESVHLGWSSFAAMWLSRVPRNVPGHIIAFRGREEVRAEFDRQAQQDWAAFLTLRAKELQPGARMVLALPGLTEEWSSGIDPLFDQGNEALAEMVVEGVISAEEHARMTIGVHPIRRRERLAPFVEEGKFQGLTLAELKVCEMPDVAWAQYERDGDAEALAMKRALFFRSVFLPSLASALNPSLSPNGDRVQRFGAELEARLKRRFATQLTAMHPTVQTILLAKDGRA